MGNPKQKWTAEEEQALKEGVAKHGPGKWKCIQKDPQFHQHLSNRTNIDLKDKWRNMSAVVQGSSTRLRIPKPKLTQDAPAPAAPTSPVNIQTPLVRPVAPEPVINGEYLKDPLDFKTNASRYNNEIHALIFEALSAAKEQNGLDIVSILRYMEKRITFETPQSFRKQLGARLRRLVQQDRLEKVENCYRLKNYSLGETDSSNGKDIWPKPFIPDHIKYSEPLVEAVKTAAFKVAEAEDMSYKAAHFVREAEMLSKMQEEADSLFQLAQAISKRFKCDHNKVLLVT